MTDEGRCAHEDVDRDEHVPPGSAAGPDLETVREDLLDVEEGPWGDGGQPA